MAESGKDLKVKLIEVDPQLFIKCRLCVERMGTYQIVPTVQQQIKYCFDINVEPFDGLPQLLCKPCEVLLDDYTKNKKKFKEKQETLITKLKSKENNDLVQQQNLLEASQDGTEILQAESERGYASSNGGESNYSNRPSLILKISSINNKTKKSKMKTKKSAWTKRFLKRYICNICSKEMKRKGYILQHLRTHSRMISKYNTVFNKLCTVELNKIDKKLNYTGENNTVMFDLEKITQGVEHNLYHVLYLNLKGIPPLKPVESCDESLRHDSSDEGRPPLKRVESCDESLRHNSSDDENIPISKKRKRFNRISSRSSSETVLINDNNSKSASCFSVENESHNQNLPANENKSLASCNETDCINIVDSSDSDVEISPKIDSITSLKPVDNKIFDKLISVCKMKYMRKLEPSQIENKHTNSAQTQSQLKHKLLSIGRKVLSKGRSFNWTGLLRYMEHTNLDVTWLPHTLQTNSSKDNLVRIMPILKNINSTENNNDASEWKDLPDVTRFSDNQVFIDTLNKPNYINNDGIIDSMIQEKLQPSENTATLIPLLYSGENLTITHTNDTESCKKLLNETPVANPKQLPKKINTHDIKLTNGALSAKKKQSVILDLHSSNNIVNEESGMLMPVITSTTSLANQVNNKVNKKPNTFEVTKKADVEKPRIKVKPASELMKPENVLQNNENRNKLWSVRPDNSSLSIGTNFIHSYLVVDDNSINTVPVEHEVRNAMFENQSASEFSNNSSTDYLILDTVEFPNTKTNSPFNYLKNLLSIHNITLLDSLTSYNSVFNCLLKIKAHFRQDAKNNPIVLCLSIFCRNNSFCLSIKNTNEVIIHMNKLSAVWQWEILKIFQGEVSKKVLLNAEKSSLSNYNSTKMFLNLLKSIKCLMPITLVNHKFGKD